MLLYRMRRFPSVLFVAVREIARCIISFAMAITVIHLLFNCIAADERTRFWVALRITRVSEIDTVLLVLQWHNSRVMRVRGQPEWY